MTSSTASTEFNPLVSIIIPVYNGANYMRHAIDSALAQSYANTEIIVINDGSNDNGETDAIAKSYGDRIRYFRKENGGCGSALNLGIARMRGDYFSWLSHDDVYFPEKIAHQVRILSDLPDKATILYGGYELIDAQSHPLTTVRPDALLPAEKLDIPLLPLLRGLIHGCSLLIPRKYFTEIDIFDESLLCTQDYALWFKFFRVAPLKFDPGILIQSRAHPEQGTHRIAKYQDECNQLWSGFLRRLRNDEMTLMEGSPYRFLNKTAEFLAPTRYEKAAQLAASMASEALETTLISVIIPFRDRIGWTIEAIRSVQAQTHQVFEILLIDDGSTDDLDALLNEIALDERIKYVRCEKGGAARARNTGLRLATGNFIAFLDSDDQFYPDKLRMQFQYMEKNGLALSHTSYERMDLGGRTMGCQRSGKLSGFVFPGIIASCRIATPTVMGRADVFKDNFFPESFEIGEDVCLWIKLTSQHELGGLDMALSRVRIGPDTAAMNTQKQMAGLINTASYVMHDPFFSQYGKQVRSLLRYIWTQVPNVAGPRPAGGRVSGRSGKPSLAARTVGQLRQYGVRGTYHWIRFLIGSTRF
jgi:glycosyltransferase involved in cell wall biosynthesis